MVYLNPRSPSIQVFASVLVGNLFIIGVLI